MTCLCLTKNRHRWLKRAIRSFLTQDWPQRELLILDDGDSCEGLARAAASDLPAGVAVRYVRITDSETIGEKRNFGSSLAAGEIVLSWDDDDWSAPGRISDQVKRLQDTGAAVTGFHSMHFTDGTTWWKFRGDRTTNLGTSLCYRKAWWNDHRFPPKHVGEDDFFIQEAVRSGKYVSEDANGMIVASVHPGNTSPRSLSSSRWLKMPADPGLPGYRHVTERDQMRSMTVNIISNIDNGHGLQRDYELLRAVLEGAGHHVNGVHYSRAASAPEADVNIYLEMVLPAFDRAPENWLIPNPEWFHPAYMADLPKFSRVLCKTHDALAIFSALHPRVEHIGFESPDKLRPAVHRERRFLHVCGKSEMKGTEAVIEAWRRHKIEHPLTVISSRTEHAFKIKGANIELITRASEEQFLRLINSCAFNVAPSQYEGWGHTIHEALGAGAVVITSGASPMNEFVGHEDLLIPAIADKTVRLARLCRVDPDQIAAKVRAVAALSDETISLIANQNRARFLNSRAIFREKLLALIESCEGRLACAV